MFWLFSMHVEPVTMYNYVSFLNCWSLICQKNPYFILFHGLPVSLDDQLSLLVQRKSQQLDRRLIKVGLLSRPKSFLIGVSMNQIIALTPIICFNLSLHNETASKSRFVLMKMLNSTNLKQDIFTEMWGFGYHKT